MSKPKVVYIISKVEKAVAFEWIVEAFKDTLELEFIIIHNNFNTPLVTFLKQHKIKTSLYPYRSKKSLPFLWIKVFFKLLFTKVKAVHTHLFEGSLVGLSAAKFAGIKKRVYTRHHSTYHLEYIPKAVKYDRLINGLATHVVAISNNVKKVLIEKEGVPENKIFLVEHGFKLNEFESIHTDEVVQLRTKYKLPENKLVVGAIARYINWKGVEFMVEGFKLFYDKNPESHLIIANCGGPHEEVIRKSLNKLPQSAYTEIKFENNLFALYRLFDLFVHVPINKEIEAYGQVYIESLASGIPSVFTLSGIASDFIQDRKNAIVVDYKDDKGVFQALEELKSNEALKEELIKVGKESVKRFDLRNMIEKLEKVYLEH